MALILKEMYKYYKWLAEDLADPRANDYFFMQTIFQPLGLGVVYLYFVYILGPKLMKDRPAFSLKYVLSVFNISQILVNLWIVIYGSMEITKLDFRCAEVDYSNSPQAIYHLNLTYLYFLVKVSDLLDTVFFVMRKKYNQVSFLHVYHHFGMIIIIWVGAKYFPGGHSLYIGFINAAVHVVMYSYYLLSIWYDYFKTNHTFKKFITQMQLVQFMIFLVMYTRLLFHSTCGYPKFVCFFLVTQNVFLVCLFGDFYIKAYIRKPKQKVVQNGTSITDSQMKEGYGIVNDVNRKEEKQL